MQGGFEFGDQLRGPLGRLCELFGGAPTIEDRIGHGGMQLCLLGFERFYFARQFGQLALFAVAEAGGAGVECFARRGSGAPGPGDAALLDLDPNVLHGTVDLVRRTLDAQFEVAPFLADQGR